MATIETCPISIASPEPVSEPLPARRLDPIPGVCPRGKFKERINKIRFKRKPSLVAEHPIDPSDDQLTTEPNDSDANLTPDVIPSQDDASIDNLREYQEVPPSEPTDPLDLSSHSDEVLGVTLLGSDPLRPHVHLSHPLVKVTLYCEKSGVHFKKSEKSRAVSSYYETANERVDYILPQLTEPAVVNTSNGFTPRWGEELVFNEDLSYLLSAPSLVLLFEVLEFKGRPVPAFPARRQGWRHVAWAFLKLRGVKNRVNLGQRLRLQLYRYPSRAGSGEDLGFRAWYHGSRAKYPSTLHVSTRGVLMREQTPAALRSRAPNQPERAAAVPQKREGTPAPSAPWSRLGGQTCRVPNSPLLASPLPGAGGSSLGFSPDGSSLAVGVSVGELGEALVYAVPSCEEMVRLRGHRGLIYDLSWSPSSLLLLTASQDATARVWAPSDPERPLACCKLLPHPSFVYACAFHPSSESILLTAGFDRVVRVWGVAALGVHSGQILRELPSHGGHVNCLRFDRTGRMFSGDSEGCVCVWQMSLSSSGSSPSAEEVDTWRELDRLELRETRGTAVRSVFPVGRRLLLHTSDGTIRLVDSRKQAVLRRYRSPCPLPHPLSRCGLSPCDTHIFLGTGYELSVWGLETGDKTQLSLQQLSLPSAHISCVDYHPLDHMLALCTYGASGSLLVSKYAPEASPLAETGDKPRPLTASSSLSGNQFADTAMLLLRERVRQRLDSISLDPPRDVSDSRRPLSSTWDSLGSLTSPHRLLRSPPAIPEEGDARPDGYESTESQEKYYSSELTLGMLGRTLASPAREYSSATPLCSTSELEEGDTEVREKAKRSVARKRRTVNKQKSVEVHSIIAE